MRHVKGRDPKGERGAKHLPSHKLIPILITFVSWTIDGLVNPCCWAGPFFLLSILGKWINKYQLYLHIYLRAHARSNRDGVVNTLLPVQTSPRLGWGGVAHTNTSADLELFSLKKWINSTVLMGFEFCPRIWDKWIVIINFY